MQLKLDLNREYAVALEGGGAKGSYQIGAWRALSEAGVRIRAVSGTSVGALNGALMVMGDLEQAEDIWRNIRFSQIMDVNDEDMKNLYAGNLLEIDWKAQFEQLKEILSNRGLDITPLRQWMTELVDEEKIRNAEMELYIQTVSLTDRKELELRAKDLTEPGEIVDMLLASAYLPVFKNETLGGKRYTDGGLQDVIPIHVLVKNGYRDIIAVRIFGMGIERRFRIPDYVQIHSVLPQEDLGGMLEFDSEQSRKNLQLGYFDTKRMLYGLCGNRFYIDRQWTEEQSYDFLVRYLRHYLADCGHKHTLQQINEKLLPRLRRKLDGEGDYHDLLIRALEQAAEEAGLDPFRIRTEDELIKELQGIYGFAAGRYPQFLTKALTFRTLFVHSKRLLERRKE